MDENTTDSGSGITSTLSDLASSFLSGVSSAATDRVSSAINPTASQNSAPSPDYAAAAATPGATKVFNMAALSLPVILVGGGLLALLVLKKR